MRGAAQDVVERDFVKAAEAVGEKRSRIVFGELLPNVTSPLLVELGLRMTFSIGLIAGISFLGFGLQPPAADWGLMINENRLSITVQPWSVVLPVLGIGLLAGWGTAPDEPQFPNSTEPTVTHFDKVVRHELADLDATRRSDLELLIAADTPGDQQGACVVLEPCHAACGPRRGPRRRDSGAACRPSRCSSARRDARAH